MLTTLKIRLESIREALTCYDTVLNDLLDAQQENYFADREIDFWKKVARKHGAPVDSPEMQQWRREEVEWV
jgi:hypothetical protein